MAMLFADVVEVSEVLANWQAQNSAGRVRYPLPTIAQFPQLEKNGSGFGMLGQVGKGVPQCGN